MDLQINTQQGGQTPGIGLSRGRALLTEGSQGTGGGSVWRVVGVREPRATHGHCLEAKAALLWWGGTLQPVTLAEWKPMALTAPDLPGEGE